MAKDRYTLLVYKKLKGELSINEAEELNAWLNEDADHPVEAERTEYAWKQSLKAVPPTGELDEASSFQSFKDQLKENNQPEAVVKPLVNWKRIATIAALVAGVVFFTRLWFDAGSSSISYRTGPGEKQEVMLPNGSSAWLNENSHLVFLDNSDSAEWLLELSGEALFSIQRSEDRLVIVKDHYNIMEVLGTVFNVRSYEEQGLSEVSVQEGTVVVSSFELPEQRDTVEANHKYTYEANSNRVSLELDYNLNDLAWQRNNLVFKDTPLPVIMEDLETHLGLEIDELPSDVESCIFSASYSLEEDVVVEDILTHLGTAFSMELKNLGPGHYAYSGGFCKKN